MADSPVRATEAWRITGYFATQPERADRHAAECMTKTPVLVGRHELATAALDLLETRKITSLLVTDEKGRIEGVLHLHDLWKTEMV